MRAHRHSRCLIGLALIGLPLATACTMPLGLDLPSTRSLEQGAEASVAGSLEATGTYSDAGIRWGLDLQVEAPDRMRATLKSSVVSLDVVRVGTSAYFRGRSFLAAHLPADPASQSLGREAGDSWWKGSAELAPNLSPFTSPDQFGSTFLGTNVTRRTDRLTVDGVQVADLSGPRADVFIAEAAPHQLVRVRMNGATDIDGVSAADLLFENVGARFGIAAPASVIDFSDLSTLPPTYTVESVDATACASPCVVSAELRNLGGAKGASAPSTVTFTLSDTVSGAVLGTCTAAVQPDVAYNATTTVSCTIETAGTVRNGAASVTATPYNPGRS